MPVVAPDTVPELQGAKKRVECTDEEMLSLHVSTATYSAKSSLVDGVADRFVSYCAMMERLSNPR